MAIRSTAIVVFLMFVFISSSTLVTQAQNNSVLIVTSDNGRSFGQAKLLDIFQSVNASFVTNPPSPILTDYAVVIADGDMWGSAMIGQLRAYVQSGGNLILTAGTPFFLAGGTDLSSLQDIIGVNSYWNTFEGGNLILTVDHPFGLSFSAQEILGNMEPGSWAHVSGAVGSLTNEVLWSDGTLASYVYSPYNGKYFYIAVCPSPKMSTLFSAALEWMLEEYPPNRPPLLISPGNRTAAEGSILTFDLSASDPDGDRLTYSADLLPPEATLNSSTGHFSWQPTYDQAGVYTITFAVSDGTASDQETIQITVINVNRSPVLVSPGNRTVDENSVLAFTLSASDPDHDSLTYSASSVPLGAAFNAAQHSFVWQPTFEQAGVYAVTFSVSDGLDSDQEAITITVNNVNRPPSPFVLISPHDLDTVRAKTVNLYWAFSNDPDAGDTAKYQLQYSVNDSASWQHTLSSITDTTYTLPALEELKTYYWKITTRDKNGGLTECSGGRFRFFAADATPPSFTIDILPNPVLYNELDIYAYPSEPLNALAQAKITSSAGTVFYPMTMLANRELTGYVLDYEIGQPGQYTISICGNDLWNNEGCTDEHIAVSPVFVHNTTTLTSPSGSFQVTVSPGAVSSTAMMICSESGSDARSGTDANLTPGLVPLRALNLKSSFGTFKKPAVISADPCMLLGQSDTECRVAVFRQTPEGLEPVSTRYDLTSRILNVETPETGTYLFCQATGGDQSGRGTLPTSSELEQNSPNPFNNETRIAFSATERCHARVEVFNTLGRLVATVLDADVTPGNYSVSWNGNDRFGNECSSGIYLYRLTAGTFTSTKRMLFLK